MGIDIFRSYRDSNYNQHIFFRIGFPLRSIHADEYSPFQYHVSFQIQTPLVHPWLVKSTFDILLREGYAKAIAKNSCSAGEVSNNQSRANVNAYLVPFLEKPSPDQNFPPPFPSPTLICGLVTSNQPKSKKIKF